MGHNSLFIESALTDPHKLRSEEGVKLVGVSCECVAATEEEEEDVRVASSLARWDKGARVSFAQ